MQKLVVLAEPALETTGTSQALHRCIVGKEAVCSFQLNRFDPWELWEKSTDHRKELL